jgi:hypothetical protein
MSVLVLAWLFGLKRLVKRTNIASLNERHTLIIRLSNREVTRLSSDAAKNPHSICKKFTLCFCLEKKRGFPPEG